MNQLAVSKQDQDFFLNNLRQETADSHRKLEENEFSKSILDPDVTLRAYQTYIAKLYGVTLACEREVYPTLGSVFADLEQRRKSHLIIRDLIITGVSAEKAGELAVSHFEINSLAQALGVMYVLEGSTLGGKVLYKHMNKTLELDASNGASYFWGYGAETGVMWKGFITEFASCAVRENFEEEVISSSVKTFTLISNWLDQAVINL